MRLSNIYFAIFVVVAAAVALDSIIITTTVAVAIAVPVADIVNNIDQKQLTFYFSFS